MLCAACGTGNVDGIPACVSCGHSFGAAPTLAGDLPPGLSSGLPTDSLAGRVIADRYVMGGLLGKGGVGAVYRARDKVVNEDIAVKVLQESPSRDPKDLDRFRRELVTARKVSHPNVIRIHDMGVLGNELFISMELLEGGSLAALLRKGAPEIPRAIAIAIGICDGLHAAHLQGVVHRDIKPDNVIFDLKGVPKVMDFGLARLTSSGTRTAGFAGTPFYMSPEQADGADPTVASDVYSLGVLLFELFTGRLPFVSESLVRLVVLHTKEAPPAPRSFRAEIPAEIEALILTCLEKAPARRPASASDIANVLRRFELRQSGAGFEAGLAGPPIVKPSPVRRWMIVAAGVSGLAGLTLTFGPGKPPVVATPTPVDSAVSIATPAPSATETATVAPPTATRTTVVVVATPIATPAETLAVASATPALVPGSVSITSIGKARFDVFVDDEYRDSVPASVQLAPGLRVVQLRQDGKVLAERRLDVQPGSAHSFTATTGDGGVVTLVRKQ